MGLLTPRIRVYAAAALAALAPAAWAETITVNALDDRPDANLTDGICDADLSAPGLQSTLRAAVQHANVTLGADTIVVPAGVYRLTIRGGTEQIGATGDLDLSEDVAIQGAGAATTIIDCKKARDRAFDVLPGVTASISGLSILKGATPNDESGGAIRNRGFVTVTDCVLSKCKALDDAGGFDIQEGTGVLTRVWIDRCTSKDDGGGIDVDGGTLTLDSCTISRCKAKSEGGGLEDSGQVVTLVNCTISGNTAKLDAGGISLEDGGTMTLTNCTVAFNKAKVGAGISVTDEQFGANTCTVANSIFASNKKANSDRVLTSQGGNVDSGNTCGFDHPNANPLLVKLAMNGGSVPTHTLRATSPALALGLANCPATDSRGVARSVPCDSGAFELVP